MMSSDKARMTSSSEDHVTGSEVKAIRGPRSTMGIREVITGVMCPRNTTEKKIVQDKGKRLINVETSVSKDL